MADLTPIEQKVLEALRNFGATTPEKVKDADMLTKKVLLPKGQVAQALQGLINKGMVNVITRHKSAGYYLTS
jgi:predicted transcriptional regulator